jgi:hypothetical protein
MSDPGLRLLIFQMASITAGLMIGSWISHREQKRSETNLAREKIKSDSWHDFR